MGPRAEMKIPALPQTHSPMDNLKNHFRKSGSGTVQKLLMGLYQCYTCINALPDEVVSEQNICSFKKKLANILGDTLFKHV